MLEKNVGQSDLKGRELSLQPRRGDAPHGRVHGGSKAQRAGLEDLRFCSSQASEAQVQLKP